MTDKEIADEEKRARQLAKSVGGILAILLGLVPTSGLVAFDRATGRFTIDDKFVSMDTIRRELRRFEYAVAVRMGNLANLLANGTVELDEWREGMKKLIGSSHVIMGAVAAGTITAAAENATVQERIESEREYADGFAADIEKKKLQTPTIKARAKSYLLAAALTFGIVTHEVRKRLGYTEARRTRTAEESCGDCIDVADTWIPIDEMPSLGSLACGNHCRCFMEYR